MVRAPPCHGGGCEFESRRSRVKYFVDIYIFHFQQFIYDKLLKLNWIAIIKYKKIRTAVRLFKNFSAELGDPSKLLFVAKLANPPF